MPKLWSTYPKPASPTRPPSPHPRPSFESSERTSLLPPSSHNPYHASGNHPTVSPYNRFSVRSLRYISILLFIVSALWWVLLLIGTFVTPPGMGARGGGWFEFGYSTLATAGLALGLMSYGTPSKVERVLWMVMWALGAVDLIIIASAGQLRWEEGWVGVSSVVWFLVVAAWVVLCNKVVEYGKAVEEERLTGRIETKRTLAEWFSVFSTTILLSVFIAITLLYTGSLILRAHDSTLSLPGKRIPVDAGRYYVHLYCAGNKTTHSGKPAVTVFLDAGEEPVKGSLEEPVRELLHQGKIDRYCYWDRPGFGWSDNAPSPLSAGMAADALSEALAVEGEDGPWVVVGAGVGSIYALTFNSRHTAQISSLLLLDPLPSTLINRLASASRGLLLWARGIISPLGIPSLWSAIFLHRNREDRVYGCLSGDSGKALKARLQENLVASTFTRNEVTAAEAILRAGGKKRVVLSSGEMVKRDREWYDGQRDMARDGKWVIVEDVGHQIWRWDEGRKEMGNWVVELVREAEKEL
ncbi:hypothetical protein RUND412_000170 [Rhizina undulata]